jgi:ankyrin repeat protein
LYKAVKRGDVIDVRRLLSVGSDPNETFAGRSPLSFAAARGNTSILRLLLDAGATPDWHALQVAAFNNHVKAVQLLLAAGAPTDAGKGETPLLNALKSGSTKSTEHPGRVRVRQLLRTILYGWRWRFRRLLYSIGWLPKRQRHSN